MKILILDDDDTRHTTYDMRYVGHDVFHTYNYIAFTDELHSEFQWDLIHLDHDLGDLMSGDTYEDGWGITREYNGVHATNRICELPDGFIPKKVIIQSINPHDSRVMMNLLERRGIPTEWRPFTKFEGELR